MAITCICTCGHDVFVHEHTHKPDGHIYHDGPCSMDNCLCRRFVLDRRTTRYETEQDRLARKRSMESVG